VASRKTEPIYLSSPGWRRIAREEKNTWTRVGEGERGSWGMGRSTAQQMVADNCEQCSVPSFDGKFINYLIFKKEW
jgi:hypothetical protein